MSRIGNQEIILPKGITAFIENSNISIVGPKGKLSYQVSTLIAIKNKENIIQLVNNSQTKKGREIHGLSRSIINNMVIGVSKGFEKKLKIEGVGYRSHLENNNLILNVGYSHPVIIEPPQSISIKIENSTNISIMGINKEIVGQIAAKVRSIRPPEPYKGKGIRYENEYIRRKVGKAGK
uniref:Ribosomal protein L6 n=1 Tax=Plumaria plumosa TaxID=189642 RepID=A0A4D6X2H6_9FLOR|nr:ribosomal protein L6 [Plumaria plumosa]